MRMFASNLGPRPALAALLALLALAASPAIAGGLQVSLTDSAADDVTLAIPPAVGMIGLPGGVVELVTTIQGNAQEVTLDLPYPLTLTSEYPKLPPRIAIVPDDQNAISSFGPAGLRVERLSVPPSGSVEVHLFLRMTGPEGSIVCTRATVTNGFGKSFHSNPAEPDSGRPGYRGRATDSPAGMICGDGSTGFAIHDPSAPAAATN